MALATTYQYPVIGTTPPTMAQMNVGSQGGGANNQATMITAQISMLDADTTGILVHNMAFTAKGLAELRPMIAHYFDVVGTATPLLTFVQSPVIPSNSVTVGKAAGSGTGFTATVFILRPHTLIQ